jgi:glycosyltransferase involved in cell wall biosynthesis
VKIVIIRAYSRSGGVAVHTEALALHLARRGHDVTVADFQEAFEETRELPGVYTQRVLLPRPLKSVGIATLFRLLQGLPGDVCVFPKGELEAGSARFELVARACYRRYLTIEHLEAGPLPSLSRRRHLRGFIPGIGLWWFRYVVSRYLRWVAPHAVFCVSGAVERRLSRDLYFRPSRLTTVRNGIDTSRFRPNQSTRVAVRGLLNVPSNAILFGAVGRLARIKGYVTALSSFARLNKTLPSEAQKAYLVLAGDGPETESLRIQARELGVDQYVRFPGAVEQPWRLLVALDVFVMPSLREGLPLALLEAMACEVPSIATDVGGIAEVISSTELGWLVQPRDEDGFLQAMTDAYQLGSERRAEMGTRARQHISANFELSIQMNQLCEAIEARVIGRPSGRINSTAPETASGVISR